MPELDLAPIKADLDRRVPAIDLEDRDIARALIAEVERLRGELDDLKATLVELKPAEEMPCHHQNGAYLRMMRERDELHAVIEEAKAFATGQSDESEARKAAEERERRIMLDTASRLRSEGDKWERTFGGGMKAADCYRGANALEELAGQSARTPQITDEMRRAAALAIRTSIEPSWNELHCDILTTRWAEHADAALEAALGQEATDDE